MRNSLMSLSAQVGACLFVYQPTDNLHEKKLFPFQNAVVGMRGNRRVGYTSTANVFLNGWLNAFDSGANSNIGVQANASYISTNGVDACVCDHWGCQWSRT